jgi:Leucine-rich repeat (LRR) protein
MSAQEDSAINNLTGPGYLSSEHLGLSELEVQILDFEGNWWRYAGAKEAAIKELFDLSAPRYYQLLNDLIDRDDALAASPMLVKRLRRLREARMATRIAR